MFTKTFTQEQHIEELRAELRATLDPQEASAIESELLALVKEAGGAAEVREDAG